MSNSIISSNHESRPEQSKKSEATTEHTVDDKKENIGKTNIFGDRVNTGVNIFSKADQKVNFTNLFDPKGKSVNLFNISTVPQTNTVNTNIFKSNAKPSIKTFDDDDDNEKQSSNASSNQLNIEQAEFKSKPIEPVMHFKYDNPWTVIKTFNLKKFKNGNNASKEFIYLTFEKHSEIPEKLHIVVRTREIKTLLFQGFLMKGISDKITNFMNKEENLKFTVIKQNQNSKEDDTKPALTREELKIQFESVQDANDFKDFILAELSEKTEANNNSNK